MKTLAITLLLIMGMLAALGACISAIQTIATVPADAAPGRQLDVAPADAAPGRQLDAVPADAAPGRQLDAVPADAAPGRQLDAVPADAAPGRQLDVAPAAQRIKAAGARVTPRPNADP